VQRAAAKGVRVGRRGVQGQRLLPDRFTERQDGIDRGLDGRRLGGQAREAGRKGRVVVRHVERRQARRVHGLVRFEHLVGDEGGQLTPRRTPPGGRLGRRFGLAIGAVIVAALPACTGSASPGPTATTISLSPASGLSSAPPISASATQPSIGTSAESSSQDPSQDPTAPATLQVSTVATGLDTPWGLGFLPDGRAVVTSRDTAAVSLVDGAGTVIEVGTIDGVEPGGEGGLLGVAVSPGFASDHLLYVYYTSVEDNRIATVELVDEALRNQQVGFTGIPKAGVHNGGRLLFGPDDLLYVGTGDAGNRPQAQEPDALGGKILRLTQDLQPAPGNPTDPAVAGGAGYDLGHRNVQGLAFDDRGRLWTAEFGQNTWDELNLIEPGADYGWPAVEGVGDDPDYVNPQRQWSTSEASPSGIAFWQGSIWMAGLRGERLWQIPLLENQGASGEGLTAEPVAQLTGAYGRLRTVAVAPDGSLWLTTSNTDGRGDVRDGDDRILRLQLG
jgi:glucose/arabinose dehydrogenase